MVGEPHKYPPQFTPEDWNAMCDAVNKISPEDWDAIIAILNGTVEFGVFETGVSFVVRKTVGTPSYYEAITGNGILMFGGAGNAGTPDPVDGTDASAVLKACLDIGGAIFVKNGTYPLEFFIFSDVTSNVNIVGESIDGVIFDLAGMETGVSGFIGEGQYAAIVIPCASGFRLENVTFKNYSEQILGIGTSNGVVTPALNCNIKNIRFASCTGAGIAIMDGSGSVVENVHGDNPYNIVSFWHGEESNIAIRDILTKPTVTTGIIDDTISFNPAYGEITHDIVIENIVGDYSIYPSYTGANWAAQVVDLAGYHNVTWRNIHVKHVVGKYACAFNWGYDLTAIYDSVIEDIHSSYASYPHQGMVITPVVYADNVYVKNLVIKDVFVDHAEESGMNFIVGSSLTPTAEAFLSNITFSNLHLIDNNQIARARPYYVSGLDVGINADCKTTWKGLTINNVFGIDDQDTPTQRYPLTLYCFGGVDSTFTDITIDTGVISGNTHSEIETYGNANVTLSYNLNVGGGTLVAPSTQVVGASPYYYYNLFNYPINVYVITGTSVITDITIARGATFFGGIVIPVYGIFHLENGDCIKITYTGDLPLMYVVPC